MDKFRKKNEKPREREAAPKGSSAGGATQLYRCSKNRPSAA